MHFKTKSANAAIASRKNNEDRDHRSFVQLVNVSYWQDFDLLKRACVRLRCSRRFADNHCKRWGLQFPAEGSLIFLIRAG
jgi:hypothetical protein